MVAITPIVPQVYTQSCRLMGNNFSFSVVANDEQQAKRCIIMAVEEVRRIEALLTTYAESSQTNLINRNAGVEPVKVDEEVFNLIERCVKISRLTQGAFDITYGSLDKRFWNFDKNMTTLPSRTAARQLVRLINYENIILDSANTTVYLKQVGMRIGFGGIGKGYAADRAKAVMRKEGIENGIVNAAGDLTVWGTQADGKPWTIGIAAPDYKHLPFASLALSEISVATSGNYEKFAIIDGVKYSHTIDPKTGYPVHGIKSVTIISSSAELADALATPVTVMGIKAGLNLINQMKNVGCIIIDDNDIIYTSKNVNLKDEL